MKTLIERLDPQGTKQNSIHVVIETPKESRIKYAYDEKSGLFRLAKILPAGLVFPFNFGFVPQTLDEDGDPLDVVAMNGEPLTTGTLLEVRPIAVIEASTLDERKKVRNDRIIGQVLTQDPPLHFRPLKFDKSAAAQFALFFTIYNSFYGKTFKVLGIRGRKQAWKLIRLAMTRFREEQ